MPTDSTATALPTPDPKWWAQSMTIWGAAITALATVAPTVGPAIGMDITPALIQQFGDRVVTTAQAGGGLLGTLYDDLRPRSRHNSTGAPADNHARLRSRPGLGSAGTAARPPYIIARWGSGGGMRLAGPDCRR